jgi:hypothetical protein
MCAVRLTSNDLGRRALWPRPLVRAQARVKANFQE